MLGESEHFRPEEYTNICPSGLEKDWIVAWHGPAAADLGLLMVSVDICRGDQLPPVSEVAGVILGGTMHVVTEDRFWLHDLKAWLRDYRGSGQPLLGICGGHQLMASYFGDGELTGRQEGTQAGTYDAVLTEAGATHPLFQGLPTRPRFHYANYLHILPSAAQQHRVLAVQENSPAVALDHGGNWYSCQFHPEARKVSWDCYYSNVEENYVSAYETTHDGAKVIQNFLRICQEPSSGVPPTDTDRIRQ